MLDQVSGSGATKKVAEIGGDEWNPDRDQAALQGDSFCDQIDRETSLQ